MPMTEFFIPSATAAEAGAAQGAAAAGGVKLRKAYALVRHGSEARSAKLAAVAADIAPAHVVGHGDDDIGAGRLGRLRPVNDLTKASK